MRRFFDHELEKTSSPFATIGDGDAETPGASDDSGSVMGWPFLKRVGLYDPEHTKSLHDRYFAELLEAVREPPLLREPIVPAQWGSMGVVKYLHNPIGRILVSIAIPSYQRFGARLGESMDRVSALRVVLAARAYFAAERRWPTDESELVPTFLPAWPESALNGEPLVWDEEEQRIQTYAGDDGTLCASEECALPLSPRAGPSASVAVEEDDRAASE
jgi:hypothetical protein